ncbi:UNC93-like protein MFSD11 [Hypsibius exemplaris]|uniref:UNC93-like protein MFSD11 n=1 Tax=Hypsibius exemplaris TaxID=2072580 RepID=A0A1W0X4M6_HYPEX|nr:UNC93-like protein MFSD11 [Hypsibius exemplaris]
MEPVDMKQNKEDEDVDLDRSRTGLEEEQHRNRSPRNDADRDLHPVIAWFRDYRLWNVLGVSLAFMVLFSAFHTCGMLQASVLSDVHDEHFNGTGKEGYYSAAAIYTVMAASNWIAPSMIAYTGPKFGMFLGGVPYCLFMAVFLRPYLGTLYASSVLLGIGAAVLWTSQGVFLTINSTDKTMSRNAGMFWAILQLSNLWGNIFATVQLTGQSSIDPDVRFKLFIGLLCVAILGVAILLILRYPGKLDRGRVSEPLFKKGWWKGQNCCTPVKTNWKDWAWIKEIVSSFRLLRSRNISLLAVTFAYTGFMLTFYSGVFGTALHFTAAFGTERNYLLGLSGVIVGLGEISGGFLFGFLGSRIGRRGRAAIVLVGISLQMISYLLLFLILPTDSPLMETSKSSYVAPNKHVAMLCAYFLGFGDASINIQIYALLGNMYAADSAPAFALFKFTQSFAAAVGFFYSSVLNLPAQLGIVAGTGILGGLTFCLVEWLANRDDKRTRQQKKVDAPNKTVLDSKSMQR